MRLGWLALVGLLGGGCAKQAPLVRSGPLRTGIWQWHAPYRGLPNGIRIDDAYVRAATMSFDGDRLVPVLPQRFEPGRGAIRLVINFDGGAVRHFEELDPESVAEAVAVTYGAAREIAKQRGYRVTGLQVDLDCPERLLSRYGDLLRRLKQKIRGDELSVTGLVSWLRSPKLPELVREVDEFQPQFYEGELPRTFDEDVPVSDYEDIAPLGSQIAALLCRVRIGVSAYGQALVFDRSKRLSGTSKGVSLDTAFRNPALRYLGAKSVAGEMHLRFAAPEKGAYLLLRVPTSAALSQAIQEVKGLQAPNVDGFVVYRLPEEEETLTLALPTLKATLEGKSPAPELRVTDRIAKNPYAAIEGAAEGVKEAIQVTLENHGDAPQLAGEPVRVDVRFRAGCAESVVLDRGDRWFALDGQSKPIRGSLERAEGVRFEKQFLGAGATVSLGSVRLSSGCTSSVTLSR